MITPSRDAGLIHANNSTTLTIRPPAEVAVEAGSEVAVLVEILTVTREGNAP
jgi:hypothetical protein